MKIFQWLNSTCFSELDFKEKTKKVEAIGAKQYFDIIYQRKQMKT